MENLRSFKNDLQFGLKNELSTIDILKFNWKEEDDIINTKDLYNDDFYPYDFEGTSSKISFELKSRRCNKKTYDTTIIPVHKIRETEKNQIFVFKFLDICSYIQYDKELFKKYEIKNVSVFRYGRRDKPTPHYHINIDDLKDLFNPIV
jgi:hypothetical protein